MTYLYPTDLKLVRDGDAIKGTWGVPYEATNDDNPNKWGYVDVKVVFNASREMSAAWIDSHPEARYVTGDRIHVRALGIAHEHSQPYNALSYHPLYSGRYLTSVDWDVWAHTIDNRDLHTTGTYYFHYPLTPEFQNVEYDSETSTISGSLVPRYDAETLYTFEGNATFNDVRRLYVKVYRRDNLPGTIYSKPTRVDKFHADDSGQYDFEYTVPDASTLLPGQWIELKLVGMAAGVAGDSSEATYTHIIGYPPVATVQSVAVSNVQNGSDIVNVLINMTTSDTSVVDTVKLQVLRNSTRKTVEEAKLEPDSSWTDVENAVGDKNVKGFVDSYASSIADPDHYTYYRVVTTHDNLSLSSDPYRADVLTKKANPVDDDDVKISVAESGDDGKTIHIVLGWNDDDSTGTEVTWSDNVNAWESNEQPNSYDVTWEDATPKVSDMDHSASLYIRGLEEGTDYYIKARRYSEEDSARVYSQIQVTAPEGSYPIAPYSLPENVVLTAPTYVKRGSDLDVSWTFDSDANQTAWNLYLVSENFETWTDVSASTKQAISNAFEAAKTGTVQTVKLTDWPESYDAIVLSVSYVAWEETRSDSLYLQEGNKGMWYPDDVLVTFDYAGKEITISNPLGCQFQFHDAQYYKKDTGTIIAASGENSFTYATLSGDTISELEEQTGSSALSFYVSMSTGSGFIDSEPVTVTIADAPTIGLSVPLYIWSKPVQFQVRTSSANSRLVYKVTSYGVSSRNPNGSVIQLRGDCVYSDAITPQWVYVKESGYTALITLPDSVDFRRSATYEISAKVIDQDTQMESEESLIGFLIMWSLQARSPSADTQIVVDRDAMTAAITPVPASNGNASDYVDVYRVTPDSVDLLASSMDFGGTVVDRFAPFSNNVPLSYRIVTRTIDGSMDWIDIPYDFYGYSMRFDWGDGRSLTLPYNPEISDSYAKDFEPRSHIDGTITGYWNTAVSRTSSLKTKTLRLSEPGQIRLMTELANYPGPVFVRLPNGAAFTANVTVSTIENRYREQVLSVSINAEKIDLTDEFRAAAEDITYPDDHETPDRDSSEFSKQQVLKWNVVPPVEGESFDMFETPTGNIRVTLASSKDQYTSGPYILVATRSENKVTLGTFTPLVASYISSAPEGTLFLLKVLYN